jgi:hypothetical protein
VALQLLPLQVRKCVLARLLGYDALWDFRLSPDADGHEDVVKQLGASLGLCSGAPLQDLLDESESLDDFLRRLPVAMAYGAPRRHRAALESGVEAVRGRVEAYLRTTPDPLQALWDGALGAASRVYEVCGVPVNIERICLRIEWRKSADDQPPHPFPVPLFVAGDTESRAARTIVKLIITPQKLDRDSVSAVPYVLFHELVAHALGARGTGDSPSKSPAFAEGWMDVMAIQTHDTAVTAAAPLENGLEHLPCRDRALAAASQFHGARYLSGADDGRAYSHRIRGRGAANRLVAMLQHPSMQIDDPRMAFWRISTALRQSTMPSWKLDEFCTAIYCKLDERGNDPRREIPVLARECLLALGAADTSLGRMRAVEAFAGSVLCLQ